MAGRYELSVSWQTEIIEPFDESVLNAIGCVSFELTQHNSWRRAWDILEILLDKALPENCSSAKLYQLLKNLLAPDIPSDQTLDKLKDALKKHLTPKPLIIPSRHKFLNRKQTEGEEKVDSSEWAIPVVPVVKSDGSIRLCADYSVTLNPNLIVPQHPLPRLDEIFGSLNGGKQFTKLDFKHAYLQMKVHPDSQKLMTINTHKGLYICKRLMYGLNGAPAIWQRYVDGLFQGMDGVKVFMDDARITGSDEISHFTALEEFFKKCREHGLKLNLNKSKFFQNEINLLGHRFDSKGLHKTDEKISAVVNALYPEMFMKFLWSKDCQVAFEQIKKEICSPKILVHYDPSLPLTLASDASPVGIGCVLSHVYPDGSERPIAFASRTLSGSEKNTPKLIKKLFNSLGTIFGSKRGLPVLAATRLLHYALILQSFEFDIIFRKTIEHGNADFLSRLPKTSEELEVKDDITIFQMSQIEALPVISKELRRDE
ncbi:retrovirus-related Pol polyprotein from transposon 412 [Trichonephila clavipes]|nr:retrovirus-related Pol polyprotein from transposon 412 [Trichonephila clavipes]